jgi:hypothetical protein
MLLLLFTIDGRDQASFFSEEKNGAQLDQEPISRPKIAIPGQKLV